MHRTTPRLRHDPHRLLGPESAAALTEWGVVVPDSAAVREAEQLAYESCSREIYLHSARSFVYAAALGLRGEQQFDAEVLAVGCLLHDVGLSEVFGDPVRPFEHVSADVAAGVAERHHWELRRRYTMHRAIVLHMAPVMPPGDVPDVLLMEAGVACDVTGTGRAELDDVGHRAVLEALPRHDFAEEFVTRMREQAALLPTCHAAILLAAGLAESTSAQHRWAEGLTRGGGSRQ